LGWAGRVDVVLTSTRLKTPCARTSLARTPDQAREN
jgi:hypothetical protein